MKKKLIAVGVPTRSHICGQLTYFLLHLERVTARPDEPYAFFPLITIGIKPVEYARNKVVEQFLRSPAEALWFIDSDIIPPENALEAISGKYDIMGACAPIWKRPSENEGPIVLYNTFSKTDKGYSPVLLEGDGVHGADAVGMAMTLIDRKVLEDPAMRVGDKPHSIFRTVQAEDGSVHLSEDLDFCERAKRLGYSIGTHHGVKCGHYGEVNISSIEDYTERVLATVTADV